MIGSYYIPEQSAAEGNFIAPVEMTAFGQTENHDAFFTGKPHVDNLGYAFFFRNYRPTLGKWQTADPLGYPDGWNNFAYCNNKATNCVDLFGGWYLQIIGASSKSLHNVQYSGTTVNKPQGGTIYTDYVGYSYDIFVANGNNTPNLTISFLASVVFRNTSNDISELLSISYSIRYSVDNYGAVSQTLIGSPVAISENGSARFLMNPTDNNLFLSGNYANIDSATGQHVIYNLPLTSVSNLNFMVVE